MLSAGAAARSSNPHLRIANNPPCSAVPDDADFISSANCLTQGRTELRLEYRAPQQYLFINARQLAIQRVLVDSIETPFVSSDPLANITVAEWLAACPYSICCSELRSDAGVMRAILREKLLVADDGEVAVAVPPQRMFCLIPAALMPRSGCQHGVHSRGRVLGAAPGRRLPLCHAARRVLRRCRCMPRRAPCHNRQRPVHAFTSGERGETRLWLPCIDQWVRKTVWRINITVPRGLTAVASGTLMQQACEWHVAHRH